MWVLLFEWLDIVLWPKGLPHPPACDSGSYSELCSFFYTYPFLSYSRSEVGPLRGYPMYFWESAKNDASHVPINHTITCVHYLTLSLLLQNPLFAFDIFWPSGACWGPCLGACLVPHAPLGATGEMSLTEPGQIVLSLILFHTKLARYESRPAYA